VDDRHVDHFLNCDGAVHIEFIPLSQTVIQWLLHTYAVASTGKHHDKLRNGGWLIHRYIAPCTHPALSDQHFMSKNKMDVVPPSLFSRPSSL